MSEPLRVRVHYDFASTLCYVAQRVLPRIEGPVAALGITLDWTPLDLTGLVGGFRVGAEVDELRRQNAARVASELAVDVRVPRVWPNARALAATALLAEPLGRGASWRERAFSAVFEEGLVDADAAAATRLAHEISLALTPDQIDGALAELDRHTEDAREEGVSGVPTFMLGAWPFGGIQSEDTLLQVFERYARRSREAGGA